ncbi:hypothetical protein N7478_011251 [Penicillium angulare]|uniref:uncharacterized protein n=1 Tax=Penicillium angulare TaxID=116970 RepID=UPI00253FEB87|nr:uncharacterized protein N7478_011251 [Penicillium angulare]KAJ5263646.1 hypothetical protein N7478_011251 [Penicillium angulare]
MRMSTWSFLVEDNPPDPESRIEARQLNDLVFRENADSLYAQEYFSTGVRQQLPEIQVPGFDLDGLSLDQATGFLQLFNNSTTIITDIPQNIIINGQQMTTRISLSGLSPGINSPESRNPVDTPIDESKLGKAMTKLPVCSRCKSNRIKRDVNLPACHRCLRSGHDRYYWDYVIGKDIARKYEPSTPILNPFIVADTVTREIHILKKQISLGLKTDHISRLSCGSNSIAESASLGIVDSVATVTNFGHRDLSSKVLCPSPYTSA